MYERWYCFLNFINVYFGWIGSDFEMNLFTRHVGNGWKIGSNFYNIFSPLSVQYSNLRLMLLCFLWDPIENLWMISTYRVYAPNGRQFVTVDAPRQRWRSGTNSDGKSSTILLSHWMANAAQSWSPMRGEEGNNVRRQSWSPMRGEGGNNVRRLGCGTKDPLGTYTNFTSPGSQFEIFCKTFSDLPESLPYGFWAWDMCLYGLSTKTFFPSFNYHKIKGWP